MSKDVLVPDIGAYTGVSVIEICVKPGDTIAPEQGLITLETDKATLEIPAPFAGVVQTLYLKVGDKVSQGDRMLCMEEHSATAAVASAASSQRQETKAAPSTAAHATSHAQKQTMQSTAGAASTAGGQLAATRTQGAVRQDTNMSPVHAGPGVRQLARELGVPLSDIPASGPKGRILKEDVQAASQALNPSVAAAGLGTDLSLAAWPTVDYASFGPIHRQPLSRIQQLSSTYLHRNWVMVPHVTQFDEADISELEAFRKQQQPQAEAQGLKLTPVVFVIKALVSALQAFPRFNASFDPKRSELVLKQYYHMGVAMDTPTGLVVPVLRDVAHKGIFQLARELAELGQKARAGQLKAADLQGSSFTISSLGGIGGTAFTPIINVPDVAILGLSKAQIKPVYEEGIGFKPRLYLPLSLSYDHRVIDGAEAARFTSCLVKHLSDLRACLL